MRDGIIETAKYHPFKGSESFGEICIECGNAQHHKYHTEPNPTLTEPHPFQGTCVTRACEQCGMLRIHVNHRGYSYDKQATSPYGSLPCNNMCFTTEQKEYHHVTCDKFDPGEPEREHISEEAMRIVYGDREKAYDSPNRNFRKCALMWTGTILEKLKPGEQITANDVALMLNQLKISRESFRPNRENRVDGVGYWECLDRIVEEDERNAAE